MLKNKAQWRIGLFAVLLTAVSGVLSVTETVAVESMLRLDEKRLGDFSKVAEKNLIRALVPYSKTFYFLDGPDQRGLAYELLQQFEKHINIKFRKYSTQYDFDWLMVAALAYQESGIDQRKRSPAGAIGVMQILPSTAADRNVNLKNIHEIENNIHAGVKYLRFIRDRYFENEPMDDLEKMLFSFASCNAGAAKVARLRNEARSAGLDPNVWFRNVEIIAAKRIGRETVNYVSNIYKYYTAYRLIVNKLEMKERVKKKAS
jgi:membrane-bound lytic murein transglycosylase MltF